MLDGDSIKARIEEFDQRHGSDCVCWEGCLLYSDGSYRDRDPFGILAEPPRDPKKLAERIVAFFEIKLNLAREEFSVYKDNLAMQCRIVTEQRNCNNPPQPPSAEAVAQLKELQKKVHHWQGKLTAARKKLEESIPEHIVKRNEYCEENRSKAASISAEIENIKI